MGLRFEHPEILAYLALLPVLAGLLALSGWRRRAILARFADEATAARLAASASQTRRAAKNTLLLAGAALAIVALARPQYGFTEREVPRKGIDVMVAIDVSSSMLSQDIAPSRLHRAREQLQALVRSMGGDRVGIIAFAGEAYLQCPLTTDYTIARQVLGMLSPDTVPVPGSALGRAIELARENFEENDEGHKVLVLLTDGEDQGSDPIEAAREAAKEGIIIHAIGIGSEEGATIPLPEGGVKKDAEGHAVNTRLDFNTLKALAAETGGVAIKSRAAGFMELAVIARQIERLEKRALSQTERVVYQERYQWFLLPALALFMAELLISDRKRHGGALAQGGRA